MALMAVSVLNGVARGQDGDMKNNIFTYVFWGGPESYDPYQSDGMESMPVAKNIYAPLVSTFLDGKPQGMIAENWTVSKDGRTWRFKIKKGLTFANGGAITSKVVLDNFRRILWLTKDAGLTLNLALPEIRKWTDYSAPLKTVYADGDALVFKFAYQPVSLFEALEKPLYGIADPKCFDDKGQWKEKGCLSESGQYVIAERLPDRLVLKNRHVFPEVAGAPDVVHFVIKVPANKTRDEWMRENGAEMSIFSTLGFSEEDVRKFKSDGYGILSEPPLRMHYLRLNHRRPPFNDVALRRSVRDTFLALLSADRDFTSEITLDQSFIPPGGMGYLKFPPPKAPRKYPGLKGMSVKVLLPPAEPKDHPVTKTEKYNKALEAALLKTLKLHGLKADGSRDYTQAYERTKSGYYDVMFNYSGLSVQEPYEALRMMFMSDVGACIPDPSGTIPEYIMKGQAASEGAIRRKFAEKINKRIFSDAAAITFTHSGFFYLHSPKVDPSRMSTFSDPIEFRAISKK